MATIKFKRTAGNDSPAGGLQPGELAYAQGSNKLFVGSIELSSDQHWANTTYIISGTENPSGLLGNLTRDIADTTHGGNLTVMGASAPVVTSGGPFGGS